MSYNLEEHGFQIIKGVFTPEQIRNMRLAIKKTFLRLEKLNLVIKSVGKHFNYSSTLPDVIQQELEEFDYIIIGVDRPHPRRLVHATDVPWIDLRSTGDGHVYFTNDSDPALVAMMTPDHEPASCQIAGAIAAGNIQFGYVNAAAAAATWLMGQLRNQPPLRERMSSIMFGELKFPEVKA